MALIRHEFVDMGCNSDEINDVRESVEITVSYHEVIDIREPIKPKVHPKCAFCNYSQQQINRHLEKKHKLSKTSVVAARRYVHGDSLDTLNQRLTTCAKKSISLKRYIEILRNVPDNSEIIIPELLEGFIDPKE